MASDNQKTAKIEVFTQISRNAAKLVVSPYINYTILFFFK